MNAATDKKTLTNEELDNLGLALESVEGVKGLILALMESPNPVENNSLSVLYNALESAEDKLKIIRTIN